MEYVVLILGAAGMGPLVRAFLANRKTSLRDALLWTWAAWLAWVLHLFTAYATNQDTFRFWALGLTGCSMVAVLGARRPQVGAWNLVVVGFLAVLSLPLLQEWFLGIRSLDLVRSLLLPATLSIGVLNYLPTRLGPVALGVGLACGGEMALLLDPEMGAQSAWRHVGLLVLIGPWLAWMLWGNGPRPANELDRVWLGFRDRYGLLWAQRVREQFNAAAKNAGWPATLAWWGIRVQDNQATPEMTALLQALLQRFDPPLAA